MVLKTLYMIQPHAPALPCCSFYNSILAHTPAARETGRFMLVPTRGARSFSSCLHTYDDGRDQGCKTNVHLFCGVTAEGWRMPAPWLRDTNPFKCARHTHLAGLADQRPGAAFKEAALDVSGGRCATAHGAALSLSLSLSLFTSPQVIGSFFGERWPRLVFSLMIRLKALPFFGLAVLSQRL